MVIPVLAIQLFNGLVIFSALLIAEEKNPLDPTALALGAMVLLGSVITTLGTVYIARLSSARDADRIIAAVATARNLTSVETSQAAEKVASVKVIASEIPVPVEVVATPENPLPVEVVNKEQV